MTEIQTFEQNNYDTRCDEILHADFLMHITDMMFIKHTDFLEVTKGETGSSDITYNLPLVVKHNGINYAISICSHETDGQIDGITREDIIELRCLDNNPSQHTDVFITQESSDNSVSMWLIDGVENNESLDSNVIEDLYTMIDQAHPGNENIKPVFIPQTVSIEG